MRVNVDTWIVRNKEQPMYMPRRSERSEHKVAVTHLGVGVLVIAMKR